MNRPQWRPLPPKPEAEIFISTEGVLVKTPKDEGFIQSLKALVPWGEREWRVADMAWWAAPPYTENVVGLTRLFFDPVEVIDDRWVPTD